MLPNGKKKQPGFSAMQREIRDDHRDEKKAVLGQKDRKLDQYVLISMVASLKVTSDWGCGCCDSDVGRGNDCSHVGINCLIVEVSIYCQAYVLVCVGSP